MKLSIIIPVYNAEKYLDECLKSIFIESDESIEIILVDDGSTDDSSSIYDKYDFDNLKVFRNKNHGVSYSRNFGLDNSTGEWIMFVDADDILCKGWKKTIFNNLSNDNDIIYFGSNFNIEELNNISKMNLIKNILGMGIYNSYLSTPWSKIFKKEKIKTLKFDTGVINGEDMLFNINALENKNRFKIVNESIYYYRFNVNSISHKYNSKLLDSDIRFHKLLKEALLKSNIDEDSVNEMCEFCLYNAYITLLNNFSELKLSLYKEKIKCFKSEPYCKLTVKQKGIKSLMIKQIKNGKYIIPFIFFKVKNKLKNNTKKDSIIKV